MERFETKEAPCFERCPSSWQNLLLKEFGKQHYDNTAYFNFDEQSELKQYFETTKDVKRILENLALINGAPILPGKTLIVFDEIQECNAALGALKYFYENAPEYHVVCAGSLLGIRVSTPSSFPVGKVEFLTVHPMTFTEFLRASSEDRLIQYIDGIDALDMHAAVSCRVRALKIIGPGIFNLRIR